MRIAQVAPLTEAVPPKLYGGTERVISWLTEELVGQGHDVTLFASGNSKTRATLIECVPTGLRLIGIRDGTASTLMMLDQVHRLADCFDIIHFHIDLLQFPLFRDIAYKCVTTLHGRLDLIDFHPIYQGFPEMPLVSISDHQRSPLPRANWVRSVYHGLPRNLLPFGAKPGDYLAFLGRIAPEKRPDRAIEIATRAGMRLKIAAKVDRADRGYWEEVIQPMISANPNVEYLGEIDDRQKPDFLGKAAALLFPIDWPEPFGLVMIEAMACGTPVIAFCAGSVPEVIDHGRSGLVVKSLDEAVKAVTLAAAMTRAEVRRTFEERFTVERMVADYVSVYRQIRDCGKDGITRRAEDTLLQVA